MGYGGSTESYKLHAKKLVYGEAAVKMMSHPNYAQPDPIQGETLIQYALRCAAHLVSPPQEEGESYDIECVNVAASILSIDRDIEARWNSYQKARS
jgi:hypothetical protein